MAYPPFRPLGNYYCIFGNDPYGTGYPANPAAYNPIAGHAPNGLPIVPWATASTYLSPTQIACLSPSWQTRPGAPINGPVDVVIVDQNPTGLPLVEDPPGSGNFHIQNVVFYQPAAWSWLQPAILSLTPMAGPGAGFDEVTVTGQHFYPGPGGAMNPNYVAFGSQQMPATYVNETTLLVQTPFHIACTPATVDVTLHPPRLPDWINQEITIAQPSTYLPDAYTYTSVWWQLTITDQSWVFTTCDLMLSGDWQDFLEFFDDDGGLLPAHRRMKFVSRLPPFEWWWNGTYRPGPIWSFPGLVPDPNGWWNSISGFRGDIFVVANGRPKDPRTWADFAGFATGTAGMLGGSPGIAATFRNRIVYAASNYLVGTQAPPLRIFDGSYDREVVRLPPTAAGEAKAAVSLLTANGTVYVSTWDAGATPATFTGRVFAFDLDSATLTPIGGPFPAGHLPYALAWHNGMLWCGTHRQDAVAIGKVYRIRPDLDTAWTEDYDLTAAGMTGVAALRSFHGTLYVGTTAAAARFGALIARNVDGTYTGVDQGTLGAAHANNGYLALIEFQDALYASYWNDDATPISLIRRSTDGVTWTTVYTGAAGTLRPFIALAVDDGTLFAVGGGLHRTAALVSTEDGVTWTDLTTQLPEDDKTALPAIGVVVL